ncbi:hypothetical protein Q9189_002167 [Teloschistes chrysophthalmus]
MERKDVPRHHLSRAADAKNSRSSSASFISRVGASASGLVRDAIVHPNLGAIANDLNGSISNNSAKSSASGSSAGPSASSMAMQSSLSSRPFPPTAAFDLGFFSCGSDPHSRSRPEVTDNYQSFFSSPSSPDRSKDWPSTLPTPRLADVSDTGLGGHTGADLSSIANPPVEGSRMYHPEVNPADGAAVVALLADPTFYIEDTPEDQMAFGPPGYIAEEVSSLIEIISEPSAVAMFEPVNPLALIPDFRDFPSKRPEEVVGSRTAPRIDTMDTRVKRDKSPEVQPWIDILTNYHDEVWGYRAPSVKDTIKETTACRNMENERKQGYPAIRRLAMLVGHISHKACE